MEKINIDIMELILKKLSYHDAINLANILPEANRAFKQSKDIEYICKDNSLINIENGWEYILIDILKNSDNIYKIIINKYVIHIYYYNGIIIDIDYNTYHQSVLEFKLNIYYYSKRLSKNTNILSLHIYELETSKNDNIYINTSIGDNKLLSYTICNPGNIINNNIIINSEHFFTEKLDTYIQNNYLNNSRRIVKNTNSMTFIDLIKSYHQCLTLLYELLIPLRIDDDFFIEINNDQYNISDVEIEIYTKLHKSISIMHIDMIIRNLIIALSNNDNPKFDLYDKNIDIDIIY